jgi:hypothetical protein
MVNNERHSTINNNDAIPITELPWGAGWLERLVLKWISVSAGRQLS